MEKHVQEQSILPVDSATAVRGVENQQGTRLHRGYLSNPVTGYPDPLTFPVCPGTKSWILTTGQEV